MGVALDILRPFSRLTQARVPAETYQTLELDPASFILTKDAAGKRQILTATPGPVASTAGVSLYAGAEVQARAIVSTATAETKTIYATTLDDPETVVLEYEVIGDDGALRFCAGRRHTRIARVGAGTAFSETITGTDTSAITSTSSVTRSVNGATTITSTLTGIPTVDGTMRIKFNADGTTGTDSGATYQVSHDGGATYDGDVFIGTDETIIVDGTTVALGHARLFKNTDTLTWTQHVASISTTWASASDPFAITVTGVSSTSISWTIYVRRRRR